MSKSVKQSDLRKLMHQTRADPPARSTTTKKYKVSAREMQLIEDQKRRKREERELRGGAPKTKAAPLPEGFFDAKPAKSILKNSKRPQPPPMAVPASTMAIQEDGPSDAKRSRLEPEVEKPKAVPSSSSSSSMGARVETTDDGSGALPEGFFDDPKQDAKVT